MGHRDLLVPHNLSDDEHHDCRPHARGSVPRASGFVVTGKPEVTDHLLLADIAHIAQRDFAKRLERGKLTFTGDVLQAISVVGRQQKFGKLLKRLTVGA